MKIFDARSTRVALPFDALIPALREMFIQECEVPLRHTHQVSGQAGDGTILIMPAWVKGGLLGIKTVMINPGNSALGLPGLHSTYILYDANTGEPLALLDGNEIASRRTAAASALAASMIARADSRSHLIVGVGRVGRLIPEAYREVFDLDDIVLWNRHPASAEAVAEDLRAQGMPVRVSKDLEADARKADIITCATLATTPIIEGRWLRADNHLDLIGSFTPTMIEADDQCFVGATVYVDTEEAIKKSGDLLGPLSRGILAESDVQATLADLCRDLARARSPNPGRTVFKAVGTALEDLAAASLILQESPV